MTKEFVPYEQALALKELGFDEICLGMHIIGGLQLFSQRGFAISKGGYTNTDLKTDGVIGAPTFSQTFRWFRIQHGLYSAIVPKKSWPDNFVSGIEWYVEICGGDGKEIGPDGTYSYEEAEQACLDKLIEICKTKINE